MKILGVRCLFQILTYPNQRSESRQIFSNYASCVLLFTASKTKVDL